jgi:hypothetical protein
MLAQQAERFSGATTPTILRSLAAAYAEQHQFDEARQTARRGWGLATKRGDTALAQLIENDIALYDAGRPNHNVRLARAGLAGISREKENAGTHAHVPAFKLRFSDLNRKR